jgi:hypothetical protein
MKWNRISVLMVALGLFFMSGSMLFAQEEMTEEEAAQKISTLEKRSRRSETSTGIARSAAFREKHGPQTEAG